MMYEQFLIHCFSDYWLQNDYMATNKKKDFRIALLHAVIYTIPFLLLTKSLLALLTICITHAIIDGTNIVNKLNQLKNLDFNKQYVKDNSIAGNNESVLSISDGYTDRPLFIRVWLIILQDNILHLIINYLSLKYL